MEEIMLNTPLYSLGDTLILTGFSTSTSGDGFYYSYSEYTVGPGEYASVDESYSYSSSGQSEYSEYFSYSSQDGVTVDYVTEGYSDSIYDSEGRLTENTSLSNSEYDYGSGNQGASTYSSSSTYVYDSEGRLTENTSLSNSEYDNGFLNQGASTESSSSTYAFANTTGYELDSSTSSYSYTSTYGDRSSSGYSSTTVSDYAYISTPTSIYDYNQRSDVTSTDTDGDGNIDSISYALYSNTADGSASVSVITDATGVVTSANEEYSINTSSLNGYASANGGSVSLDSDGDGIIDYVSEYSLESTYDASYNFISSRIKSIYKTDFDDDGNVDHVQIVKETREQTSSRRLEIIWEDNGSSPATLTIGIEKDTNGDGNYDYARIRFPFGEPPSSWTTMGGHVATPDDTLIT